MVRWRRWAGAGALLLVLGASRAGTQTQPPQGEEPGPPPGDNAASPGPLATDLSGELRSPLIAAVMRRVADWQIARIEGRPSRTWTYATLYDGPQPPT